EKARKNMMISTMMATMSRTWSIYGSVSSIPIFLSVMLQPAISDSPTGGVMFARAKFMMSTMPKWTGSMPNSVAIGMNIGLSNIISDVTSVSVPSISSINDIISSNMSGELANWRKKSVIIAGIWLTVSTYVNAFAADIMISMVAEVTAEVTMISLYFLKSSSL